MAKVNVERIALHVPHMTPHAARELADGVAKQVVENRQDRLSGQAGLPVLHLQHVAGETPRALEARIAREIARALRKG
ncbi:MAG TPA: hypothetical protein VF266_00445 [Thermoanaerobaculia bacterium]